MLGRRIPLLGGSIDSDATLQKARILADGGIVTDILFLSNFIKDLKAGGCYSLFDGLWIPVAIKKDGADFVSTIYDVSPAKSGGVYYDGIQSTAGLQQLWQDNQLDGRPIIFCDSARSGGYPVSGVTAIGQPSSSFIICRKIGSALGIGQIMDMGSGAPAYYFDTTEFRVFAGSNYITTITQTTWAQLTVLINFGGSTVRRHGTQLSTANPGSNSWTSYNIGGPTTLNGNIAFVGVIRQSISTVQRDYIESLLNNKYYPSTV